MSSGTSYDWAYERERERQHQMELRAELERLRVEHRQLQRLRAALATQGIRAASVTIADVAQDATAAQLGVAVAEARTGLNALKARLDRASSQRAKQRAAQRAAVSRATVELPPEPSLRAALAQERAREKAAAVAALASAARELVATESARCAEDDHDRLVELAEGVGQLTADRARLTLVDLESRVAASIQRRRHEEEAEQVRMELLTLAGELDWEERAALRGRINSAPDEDLTPLRDQVLAAVAVHNHRRARTEVTEQVLAALRAQGYELGESFDNLLADNPPVTLLTSTKTPNYGVRLTVDPDRERLHTTVVRRDDVEDGDDLHAQRLVCADLDRAQEDLTADGVHLRTVLRRPVQGRVPTMAARHWPTAPEQLSGAECAEQLRRAAERERQARAHRQEKGRRA